MAIEASVTGNMLENPSQRSVRVSGDEVRITTFRMMSDVWTGDGDSLVQDNEKSSPVAVTIWNEVLGDAVAAVYRKGMRVVVSGDLHLNHYVPSEAAAETGQKERHELRCAAHRVALLPNRVVAITMRPKRDAVPAQEGADHE